jgi:3',5'-cyclic AMP phosphodiesterase CpdA
LAAAPDSEPSEVLPGSRRWGEAFGALEVDLVLCGHAHRSFVTRLRWGDGQGSDDRETTLVACGTATSSRGRGSEAGWNTFNLVRVFEGMLEVTQFMYGQGPRSFAPSARLVVPRRGRWLPVERHAAHAAQAR